MKKKAAKTQKRNFVAKHMTLVNKPKVFVDKKKEIKKRGIAPDEQHD
jgi:hypothetical protein